MTEDRLTPTTPLEDLRAAITQYNGLIMGIMRDFGLNEAEAKATVARVLEWVDSTVEEK